MCNSDACVFHVCNFIMNSKKKNTQLIYLLKEKVLYCFQMLGKRRIIYHKSNPICEKNIVAIDLLYIRIMGILPVRYNNFHLLSVLAREISNFSR